MVQCPVLWCHVQYDLVQCLSPFICSTSPTLDNIFSLFTQQRNIWLMLVRQLWWAFLDSSYLCKKAPPFNCLQTLEITDYRSLWVRESCFLNMWHYIHYKATIHIKMYMLAEHPIPDLHSDPRMGGFAQSVMKSHVFMNFALCTEPLF